MAIAQHSTTEQRPQATKNRGGRKNRPASFGKTIAISVLIVAAAFGALELVFSLSGTGEDTMFKPDRLLGYCPQKNMAVTFRQEGFSRSSLNSYGFRDKEHSLAKPAGVTRIVMIGDSTTVGFEVPFESTFANRLQQKLQQHGGGKFEVLNCGMSGYGTGQEYLNYKRIVEKFNPDVLVLTYNLGDSDDNVGSKTNPPRPFFSVTDGKLKADWTDVDEWYGTSTAKYYEHFDWLRRNSRVLSVLNKVHTDLLNSNSLYKTMVSTAGHPVELAWNKAIDQLPSPVSNADPLRSIFNEINSKAKATVPSPPAAAPQEPVIPELPDSSKSGSAQAGSVQPGSALSGSAQSGSAQSGSVQSGSMWTGSTRPDSTQSSSPQPNSAAASTSAAVQAIRNESMAGTTLIKGYIAANEMKMKVVLSILDRLNNDCARNNCRLAVVAMPAFNNSAFYYRELNDIAKFASQKNFTFIPAHEYFPPREPMAESPYFFNLHFTKQGHERMSAVIYNELFLKKLLAEK